MHRLVTKRQLLDWGCRHNYDVPKSATKSVLRQRLLEAIQARRRENLQKREWRRERTLTTEEDVAKTLALCRCLGRCGVVSRESEKETAILGPRGSLQTPTQRAHAPLLVLVAAGQERLVKSALEAGAHSCLVLPINAKEVRSMLVRARARNQPGRHTDNLEGAQSEDRWRDEGGQG